MCEYGFTEGIDFCSYLSESTGGRPATEHQLSLNMAKEICMIQRSEIGKEFRRYFIQLEEKWNSPMMVMSRALQMANSATEQFKKENSTLKLQIQEQTEQIAEMKPKYDYCNDVINTTDLFPTTVIAKDYGWSAVRLNKYLAKKGIQYKVGKTWVLTQKYANKGYAKTYTKLIDTDKGKYSVICIEWYQKGRYLIYTLLKEDNVHPVSEELFGDGILEIKCAK